MIIFNSCVSFVGNNITQKNIFVNDYGELVEKHAVCRGNGALISKGSVSGKLSFHYTCAGDEVYIHFSDFLGRKTMMVILNSLSVEAWDIMQNVRFTSESILLHFPFFEFITPKDLVSIFWGIEPIIDLKKESDNPPNVNILFSSNKFTLDKILFSVKSEKQSIELSFKAREFGIAYPHLIKHIPTTVPPIKS